MTKTVHVLCLTIFVLGAKTQIQIDFSSCDRKLAAQQIDEERIFKFLNPTGSPNGYGHCFKNS